MLVRLDSTLGVEVPRCCEAGEEEEDYCYNENDDRESILFDRHAHGAVSAINESSFQMQTLKSSGPFQLVADRLIAEYSSTTPWKLNGSLKQSKMD